MKIIKRSGQEVDFNPEKIKSAISRANLEVKETERATDKEIEQMTDNVVELCEKSTYILNVEDIQELVETEIMNNRKFDLAKVYIRYRYKHSLARKVSPMDSQILSLVNLDNEELKTENSNKNPVIVSTQRDYIAGEVSKDISKRLLLPEKLVKAHEEGIIHIHDLDYYIQDVHNCSLVNLEDMLQNGTVISGKKIDSPKTFSTACNIATQIIAKVASSQFGGQTITLAHLAPFVQRSRDKFRKKVREEYAAIGLHLSDEQVNTIAEMRVNDDIERGIQTMQYQILTLMTCNGQAPFVTVFMYLNEVEDPQTRKDLKTIIKEVLRQRMIGVKNEKGVYVTPSFPKLIYVTDEDNIWEGTPDFDVTMMAAQCSAKRMVPDYISAKKCKELKEGNVFPCMGCRSFLHPWYDENGKPKFYGRFNVGVTTINLVDIALSSGKNFDKFWEIFDERLELCKEALLLRHKKLRGTPSDVAPELWQHGAMARLKPGETIDKLLFNGYSSISLGYAGLYECVYYMTGESHTDKEHGGYDFAMKVMKYLNEAAEKWKEETTIGFGIYGTPIESTTYRFAKLLKKRFGVIEGVTDKGYITNSYHVQVREKIDAFSKITFEAPFQELSTGGAISYVEIPNLEKNISAIIAVMQHMYENTLYAEFNTRSDVCQKCNFEGEIKIVEDEDGKLVWECPQCGNRDQSTMNVTRRTCGYLGENYWNQGRTQEINERVLHL